MMTMIMMMMMMGTVWSFRVKHRRVVHTYLSTKRLACKNPLVYPSINIDERKRWRCKVEMFFLFSGERKQKDEIL